MVYRNYKNGLNERGMLASLDHLGENVASREEAALARDAYLAALNEIARQRLQATISIKLSQLGLDISEIDCRTHLETLARSAEQHGSFVEVDMESSAYTDRTVALVTEMRRRFSSVGGVIQASLYRSEDDIRTLLRQGVRIRLCKGAYQEPASVAYPRKSEVDENYIRLLRLLLASGLYHSIATHDPRMIEEARRFARQQNLPPDGFEFQMLYGVRQDLQNSLVQQGYRLRIYVPFGSEWFPYFMRRLAERPANLLFALKSFSR